MDKREIPEGYLQHFINTIRNGNPVMFVRETNLLAVDHPEEGYLVVQLADKVVPNEV